MTQSGCRLFGRRRFSVLFLLLNICLLLPGCGTMSNGRRWGEDATLTPGWSKLGETAADAITSPVFYLPIAAALLLQIDGADRRISDWARDHTPVYGSNRRAEDWSNDIRSYTGYTMYLTMLAAPSGDEPLPWGVSKVKGLAVQQAAVSASYLLISNLKDVTGRERPNNADDRSFPAGKTPSAMAFSTISSRNIGTLNIPQAAKTTLNVGLGAVMAAEAWSQVEAGSHYPADTLAGISAAYFITSFMNDSFMGLEVPGNGMPVAGFDGKELYIGYCWRF